MKQFISIISFILLSYTASIRAQDRIQTLKSQLDKWSTQIPALNEKVDISVSGTSIQEFLRGVANNVDLNLSVDPDINFEVVNNFSNVRVADMLLFFCKEYNLTLEHTGNIISITKYNKPAPPPPTPPKPFTINYDQKTNNISIDVKGDSLKNIARAISDASGKNIIIAPGLANKWVEGYIKEAPFLTALKNFSYSNGLETKQKEDNSFFIDNSIIAQSNDHASNKSSDAKSGGLNVSQGTFLDLRNSGKISVRAYDVPIGDLIKSISDSLGINYSFISDVDKKTRMNLYNVSYDDFLEFVLKGTDFMYRKVDGIYVIGKKSELALHKTVNIYLKHRTVDKISDAIPTEMKDGVELTEFPDLNCLIVTGNASQVDEISKFVHSIDQTVPVVLIQIMIVDVTKTNSVSSGINAGFGTNPNSSAQTVLPGVDYQFSTAEINNLFQKINGLGWINLGKVTPDFYLSLKALEADNYLKIRSTPKLSTLNGHEAVLTSGEQRYYKEERNNFIGTQNPALSSSFEWKPINADLSITITPEVSGDDNITLAIEVKQAEFQPQTDPTAPPGSVTRSFKSLIRMKNKEMILLGGLDKITDKESGQGIPFLSRIPVIKWFFSSKTKATTNGKLNVFIQPTIIY